MRDVRAHRDVRGILVFANEAPPSPGQRALIQRWFKDTGARGSVMTDSLVARGAVTALHWLGVPVRAFSRADLAAALSYVGISEARALEAQRCAQALLAHTVARRAAG
ncbi:MAG TPA: hypothetical protein VJR89_18625 [Polyangiales bacterium]|nr:hypothetical protein [Polyangiales bacterium]